MRRTENGIARTCRLRILLRELQRLGFDCVRQVDVILHIVFVDPCVIHRLGKLRRIIEERLCRLAEDHFIFQIRAGVRRARRIHQLGILEFVTAGGSRFSRTRGVRRVDRIHQLGTLEFVTAGGSRFSRTRGVRRVHRIHQLGACEVAVILRSRLRGAWPGLQLCGLHLHRLATEQYVGRRHLFATAPLVRHLHDRHLLRVLDQQLLGFELGQRARETAQIGDPRLRLLAGLQLLDQLRQRPGRLADGFDNLDVGGHGLVDHAVQQLLKFPRKFADFHRPHQAAATLDGMKGAANVLVGVFVFRVQHPVLLQARDVHRLFLRFLQIDRENLGVAARFQHLQFILHRRHLEHIFGRRRLGLRLLPHRWLRARRWRTRPVLLGDDLLDLHLRVVEDRRHGYRRRGQVRHSIRVGRYLFRCRRGFRVGCGRRFGFGRGRGHHRHLDGVLDQLQHLRIFTFLPEAHVGQQFLELGIGEVENGIGVTPVFAEGFEVILEADHHLRQCVEAAGFHELDDVVAFQVSQQAVDHCHRARLVEEFHRAAGFFHHRHAVIDIFGMAGILDELENRVLGFLYIIETRGHHRGEHVVELVVSRNVGIGGGFTTAGGRLPFLHSVEGLLDLYQFRGHRQQLFFVGRLFALQHVLDELDLRLDQLALGAEADHRQGVRNDVQLLRQVLQRADSRQVAVDVNLECRFHRLDIGLHGFADGFHQRLVGAGDIAQHFAARRFRRQELFQPVSRLDRLRLGSVALGLGDVIEKILDQLDGLALEHAALTDDQYHSKQRVDLAEQILDRHAEFELLTRQGFDQSADDPPDARHLLGVRSFLQRIADLFHALEVFLDLLLLDQVEERELVDRPQFLRHQPRRLILAVVDLIAFGVLLVHRQVGQKQQFFREQVLVANRPNIV